MQHLCDICGLPCTRAQPRAALGGRGVRWHPGLPVAPPAPAASMPAQPGRAHRSPARLRLPTPPAMRRTPGAAVPRPRHAPGHRLPRGAAWERAPPLRCTASSQGQSVKCFARATAEQTRVRTSSERQRLRSGACYATLLALRYAALLQRWHSRLIVARRTAGACARDSRDVCYKMVLDCPRCPHSCSQVWTTRALLSALNSVTRKVGQQAERPDSQCTWRFIACW